ncbi:MAG: DUF1934 domain-containing protein [Lachnospiraceae bacterium]|nr:DUF1934 domain-containing protein [Lachnospiraceae bacterium]
MNKDVRIKINGLHFGDGESSDVGIDKIGTCYYKDGKYYVCFEEISPDDLTSSKSILKLNPHMIEFIRRGAGKTHFYFEQGKLNHTYYNTVAGNIFISVDTKYLDLKVSDDVIRAKIEYELLMNEVKVSDCVLEIEILSQ